MASRALLLPWMGLALLLAVTEVAGQDRSCDLVSSAGVVITEVNQARVSYTSFPRLACDDGTFISADSSVTFEATSFHQLFGSVIFRDNRRELHADRAQYFDRAGRLQAQGSVRVENRGDGSWFTGEDLVLLQAGDQRAEDEMTMREGRPHASLVPRPQPDSTTEEALSENDRGEDSAVAERYEVDADMIHMVGDGLLQARGRVEVRHESLVSYGDSLDFNQDLGSAVLFDNARILSQDAESGDTLDIRGDTITMDLPNDQVEGIEARGRAHLLAEGVDMRGPIVRLELKDGELERVFAVQRKARDDAGIESGGTDEVSGSDVPLLGPTQPRAFAEDIDLTGDSIEADLSEGELERVVATGNARGVSRARDSLNTDATDELIRTDWIEGDTITATFGVVTTEDGRLDAGSPDGDDPPERQLELLVAQGEARSFYRSEPDSTVAGVSAGSPALDLNYVIGDEIRLFMKNGGVDRMEVDNPTGIFLQPRRAPIVDPDTLGANGDRR